MILLQFIGRLLKKIKMTTKVIMSGSRGFRDFNGTPVPEVKKNYLEGENYHLIAETIPIMAQLAVVNLSDLNLTVLEGEAHGLDLHVKNYCLKNGIAFDPYPADWKGQGKVAGPIRNKEMAYATLDADRKILFAFLSSLHENLGTRNMINMAMAKGLEIYVTTELPVIYE